MRMIAVLVLVAGACAGCGKNAGKDVTQSATGQPADISQQEVDAMSESDLRKEYAKYLGLKRELDQIADQVRQDLKIDELQSKGLDREVVQALKDFDKDPRVIASEPKYQLVAKMKKAYRDRWVSLGLKVGQ